MTKVETLQAGIATLESQIQEIRSQRWEAEQSFNEKLTTEMARFFRGVVYEDIIVTATSHRILFSMLDDKAYLKDIFEIYLRENYTRDRELPYKGIELHYYTTGTNSTFELTRLENLGRVASIVKGMSNEILQKVNTLAVEYTKEIKEKGFYKQISEIEDKIRDARSQIREIEKQQATAKLFSEEGIIFDKGVSIRMKYKYSPTIKNIKLVEVNAKGTRAKAVFTYAHGDYVSSEENVDVQKILEQVL
jgi:hypothetical protein